MSTIINQKIRESSTRNSNTFGQNGSSGNIKNDYSFDDVSKKSINFNIDNDNGSYNNI